MDTATSRVQLESPRLVIRGLEREDLEHMQDWRPFRDPLHELWNLPRRTSASGDIWFLLQSSDPTHRWFAIERRTDGQVIGALSLREIRGHVSARLGIRLGADFVDQGYGSEALRLFLSHYFHTLDFQRLVLDVAATNSRAIHVYAKLGFRHTGHHYRNIPKEQDLSFLQQERYRHLRRYFRRHFGAMQLLFHDMVLERSEWEKRTATQAT